MDRYTAVAEKLRELTEDDILVLWNTMTKTECGGYRHIWENSEDELKECYNRCSIVEILQSTNGGHYDGDDSYFIYNEYGCIISFTDFDDYESPVDFEELATWFCDVFEMTAEYIPSDDLEDDFFNYLTDDCGVEVPDNYTIEDAKRDIEEEYDIDFVSEDWDDYVQIISDNYETE